MNDRQAQTSKRGGFTLTELLMVMMILSLLSAMAAMAYERASASAKQQRTEAIIRKIDSLIMERWDGYRTRAIAMRIPPAMPLRGDRYFDANKNGHYDGGESITNDTNIGGNYVGIYNYGAAEIRLLALRQLQRMEMPDRVSDLAFGARTFDPPYIPNSSTVPIGYASLGGGIPMAKPALWRTYLDAFRRATGQVGVAEGSLNWAVWSPQHEGAECLYLQISTMRDGDKNALEWFGSTEVGDVDNDGMKEILDGWGNPISFLRWAPGFTPYNPRHINGDPTFYNSPEDPSIVSIQSRYADESPDPFDPLKVDGRYSVPDPVVNPAAGEPSIRINQLHPFALRPLIFSAGPDKRFDMNSGSIVYATLPNPNDPYFRDYSVPSDSHYIGTPLPIAEPGPPPTYYYTDNITNHDLKGN